MKSIVFAVSAPTKAVETVKKLAKSEKAEVVLVGLIDKNDSHREETDCWQNIFEIQDEIAKEKIEVAVSVKEGDVSEVIAISQTLDLALCVLPKDEFLALDSSQAEELLGSMKCPVLLY